MKKNLECNGQNLFRTVEKKNEKIKLFGHSRAPKNIRKCHILTTFPVLGKLTHISQERYEVSVLKSLTTHLEVVSTSAAVKHFTRGR